jgi:hypothetical protein
MNDKVKADRFVKLDDAGAELPADAATWSQVLDRETNLVWLADPLPKALAHKKAMDAAAKCDVGGQVWRAPTIREQLSLVDYDRFNPAINTDFFRCQSDWFWTASPWADSPASGAWLVFFSYGNAYYYHHGYGAFVRPVRSLAASGQ